ncbi:ACT domain-containing protein [Rhodobacter sp. SGA-6-6]|nr:ACT domain-containing protein [Rhodobacter sp. SGA-6-6]
MHNCTSVSCPESRCPLSLRLRFVPGRYAVARLDPESPVPEWASGPGFSAIIRADDELTIVCHEDRVPEGVQAEAGWVCLRTIGPFDFQATGIVHSLIAPLSSNGIGVFVVCTFDGEHLLIAESDCGKARDLLGAAGHKFLDEAERT